LETASVILLWVAFLLYAAAFAFFVYHLFSKRPAMNRAGMILAAVGLSCHTAALIARGAGAGHVPGAGAYESFILVAWAIALVYHVLESLTRIKAIGLYVMPVVCLFLALAWANYRVPRALAPVLRSDVVALHVVVTLIAVAAFYVAGGAGAIYLIEERQLRRRHPGPVLGRLPSLATLDRLIYHAILFGLPFLTLGLVAGVIRAVTFGVPRWGYDALVLLALFAWVVYVAFVYGRMTGGWRGRRAAYFALAGLVVLLAIRFVAVPYLTSFHTYGG
jgi:ABC-type transport system involved in cytochrome c biogenesis permease subunit